MTANEFVRNFNMLLSSIGSREKDLFKLSEILPVKHQTSYRDELSSLINNYRIDKIAIGNIEFLGKYQVLEKHLVFGKIELDLLAVDRESKEIVLLDHDVNTHVMMYCTKSSKEFLPFIFLYSQFIISGISKDGNFNVPSKSILYETCGGRKYESFADWCFY